MNDTETPPPNIQKHMIVSLGHSVGVILAIMSGSDTDSIEGDTLQDKVTRNMNHILTVCDYPWFAERDMSSYRAIAVQAQAWLQENPA